LSTNLWLAPIAALCGAIASTPAAGGANWPLPMAMAVVLSFAWLTLWCVVAQMPWANVLASWDAWTKGRPLRPLPYARPDSDAARAALRLGQLRGWASEMLWPHHGVILLAGVAALIVAAVLAAALGAQAILLTLAAVCVPQIAVIACRGNGHPDPLLQAAMLVTLPMLLGYASFAPISLAISATAAGFGLVFAGLTAASTFTRDIGYGVVLAALIATRQPIGAFVLAVLWAPHLLLRLTHRPRAWAVAAMLTVALAFAQ
jgi:hypothetical protein